MKRLLAIVLLIGAVPCASAQGLRFSLVGSLSLAGGTEHKAVVGQEHDDDTIALADLPAFTLWRAGPRGHFALSYKPEYEYFDRHHDFNSWNHAARLYFTYAVSPRFRFEMGDSAMSTKDPSRHLANSFLLLPRSRYQENAAFGGFDYDFTPRTTWSARYDHTITRYGLPQELRKGFFDQMGSSVSTTLAHRIGVTKKVAATYAYLTTKLIGSGSRPVVPADPTEPGLSTGPAFSTGTLVPTHYVSGSYTEAVSPGFAFALSSGVLISNTNTWTLTGQVEKRMRDIWLDGGYSRTVSFLGGLAPAAAPAVAAPFASGLMTSNVFEMITLSMRGKASRRIGFETRATGSRNAANLTGSGVQSRSFTGRLRIDYELSERLLAFVSAEFYNQNLNQLIGIPIGRRRYLWGLEISMSRRDRTRELEQGQDSNSLAPFVSGPVRQRKEEH